MKKIGAYVKFEVIVKCPYCEHRYDLHNQEPDLYDDGIPGFTREEGFDFEVECPKCEKEFIVDIIEY